MRPATRTAFFVVALPATIVIAAGFRSADTATVPSHAAARPLVSYERTGGIAGVDDRVAVFGNGSVTVRHHQGAAHRAQLSARRMRALRHAIEAAHFEQPVIVGPTGCADCFLFQLRHDSHTLSFSQLGAPARLSALLLILTPLADGF